MKSRFSNTLLRESLGGRVCMAMGIRMVTDPQVVSLAANAGFNALFIDLEHSTLSICVASQHCIAGLHIGVTPLVGVPYQCGNGFIQRVLDGGAMGIVFPHIYGKEDATAAVSICKYAPQGKRSMTGQLPVFSLKPTSQDIIMSDTNANASSVCLMIETKDSIDNIEEMTSVDGADMLLIGSNDLAIELGVPNQFKSEAFRSAPEKVSQACQKHGKNMGLAGIYNNTELHSWAINKLQVGFILGGLDSAFLARAGQEILTAISRIYQG